MSLEQKQKYIQKVYGKVRRYHQNLLIYVKDGTESKEHRHKKKLGHLGHSDHSDDPRYFTLSPSFFFSKLNLNKFCKTEVLFVI